MKRRKTRRNPSLRERARRAAGAVRSGYHGVKRGIAKVDRAVSSVESAGYAARGAIARASESHARVARSVSGTISAISFFGYAVGAYLVYQIGKGMYAMWEVKMATKEMTDSVAVIKTGTVAELGTWALQATGLKTTITPSAQDKAIVLQQVKILNDGGKMARAKALGFVENITSKDQYAKNVQIVASLRGI